LSATAPSVGVAQQSRVLGVWMCTALVVGNVIAVGVFVLPASLAPYGLTALTGWLITLVGCCFLAISFAYLARAFPQDDGPYTYTKRAFGDGIAFAVMWAYWVSTWVTNATIAVAVVGYLTIFIPVLNQSAWLPPVVALGLIWFFVVLNLLGARAVGWVQVLTTVLKLLAMLAVIGLGVWVLIADPAAYHRHPPVSPRSFSDLSGASTLTLYAMLGIECATIPACRVRNPERTIPLATVIGTIVTAVVYIGVSIVPMLLIPQTALAKSDAPIAELFVRFVGGRSGEIIALLVTIGALGALNGWTMILGEVTQNVARHGHFPQSWAKENRHGAPTIALLLTGVIASAMLLCNYTQSINGLFTFLSVVVTAANLPMYFTCTLAIVALRRRKAMQTRPSVAMMAAGTCAALYCAWAAIGIGLKPLLWALVLCLCCLPVYAWSRRRHGQAQAMPQIAPNTPGIYKRDSI
jgi:APA family basic amino acid/polyamine antiporter